MRKIADLTKLTEAEWLAMRRQGLGSSDAAAVLGVSPWRTPLQVYAEKLGLLEAQEETPEMRWGKLLEPLVADEYARETGRAVEHPHALLQHDQWDWMLATPDRFAIDQEQGQLTVEIKTTNMFRAEEWAEEPPLVYQVQLQHLLAVTGMALGSLACLIGGSRLVWCDLPRNEPFISLLYVKLQAFWLRVQRLEPPEATGADLETLARLYPKETGEVIELPELAGTWDAARVEADEQIKKWKDVRADADAKLRAAIGEAAGGRLAGGVTYSLKTVNRKAYTVEASSHRELRRRVGKS